MLMMMISKHVLSLLFSLFFVTFSSSTLLGLLYYFRVRCNYYNLLNFYCVLDNYLWSDFSLRMYENLAAMPQL